MAEDLRNYKLQLQQVEAALLTDPENEELLKLKSDLEEVIELTRDLIKPKKVKQNFLLAAEEDGQYESQRVYSKWQVGEKCLAKWRTDGSYYEALIEEVASDYLKVKFDGYTTLETVTMDNAKPLGGGVKRPLSGDESKQGKGYNREY